MTDREPLRAIITDYTGHQHARLLGRGTTALYVTFRALAMLSGPGEIVLPDLICSTVLDAVLLAGHTPVFADVLPGRWTLDPVDARQKTTGQTRAVLVAHLFGHVAAVPRDAFADLGVPIIEDAIQGLGGAVGSIGDMTVIGFAESKMIGGRGGVILTDNSALWDAIGHVAIAEPLIAIGSFGPNERLRAYRQQLQSAVPDLLYPFDESAANVAQIEAGWQALAENVRTRNANARYLADQLADTTLQLAAIQPGDAIWRFTFAAPTVLCASWIARHLQRAGLPGSRLYPSLSTIFAPEQTPIGAPIAPRLVNLWVDPTMDRATLDRVLTVIRSAPGVLDS
jgi:dTDP-4-amino-4,6-dideoxygalactose transaminase